MKLLIITLLSLSSQLFAEPQLTNGPDRKQAIQPLKKVIIKPSRQVVYKKPAKGKALKLDIFEPKVLVKDRSCVVFFFGGGWVGGTTKQFHQHANDLAAKGVLAIVADYRTKKSHRTGPEDAVRDAKSAIQWVRKHAKELKIDPNKIIAAGGSAGGHLAVCTDVIEGLTDGPVSSKPNGIIAYNPVLDTTKKGYGANKMGADKTTLSPVHHIRKGIVPTLIFHGTADKTVPFENAERFTKLMKEAGNRCTLVPFKGKDHGFFNGSNFRPKNNDKDYDEIMAHTLKFLKEESWLKK